MCRVGEKSKEQTQNENKQDKVSYQDGSRSEPISWQVNKYLGRGKNID